MSFKLREIFFFLGILWATTLPPGNADESTLPEHPSPSADSGVPDVVLKYEMNKFPKVNVKCPANSTNYNDGTHHIMELICLPNAGTKFDYKIRVPILTKTSKFLPKKLSITVSKDEDAIVDFRKPKPNQLRWKYTQQKVTWPKISLDQGKKVVLPHASLNGSGFIYFTPPNKPELQNISLYGAVAIIIRECPRDRYGENCQEWCKDCMYGGICHGRSGECVCPPGRKGNQCEEGCERSGSFGRNCDKQEVTFQSIQTCLPAPYGCSCGPGYQGFKCNKACKPGRWGVDCSQSCGHCESNKCDKENGNCKESDDVRPCAGDLLGLPRLRKKPNVTVSSGHAEVSFEEESDGALPSGAKIMGYQVVMWKTDQEMMDGQTFNISDSKRSVQLSPLEFCTDYQLAVLVKVQLKSSEECIANGALRGERIHKTSFKVFPEELPVTSNITISGKSQSEFTVSWKESDIPKCNIRYEWKIMDEDTGDYKTSQKLNDTSFSVTGLTSYTNYSVVIESVLRNTEPEIKSRSSNVTVKTLPKLPVTTAVPYYIKTYNQEVTFKWKIPEDTEGDIFYQYKYEMKFVGCSDKGNGSELSPKMQNVSVTLPITPYTKYDFLLKVGNEAGLAEEGKNVTWTSKSTVPDNKVMNITCDESQCNVTLEEDCKKKNGDNLTISYKFEAVEENIRKHEKEDDGIERKIQKDAMPKDLDNESEWVVNLPEDLHPNTEYRFKPFVTNSAGRNPNTPGLNSTTFITKAIAPHNVTSLTAIHTNDSLNVTWGPPPEWPPTGDLESYKIIWFQEEESDQSHENLTNENWFNIEGLVANQTYKIEISAKNKDVDDYGECVTTTTTTMTTTSIQPSIEKDAEGNGHTEQATVATTLATAANVDQSEQENTATMTTAVNVDQSEQDTTATMTTTANDEEILTTVSLVSELEEPPVVLEEPDGELPKIILPKVKNPPAWQYVVVMESKDNITEDVWKKTSVEIVEKYITNSTRKKRSIDPIEEEIEGWVAGVVSVSDNLTTVFEIGNKTDNNKPLEEKDYCVVVVTEMKSGNVSEFISSGPVKVHGKVIASGLSGMMFGVLIFLFLIALFAWTYKKNQNKIIVRTPEEDQEKWNQLL